MRKLLHRVYRRVAFVQPWYRRVRAVASKVALKQRVARLAGRGTPLRIVIGANKKYQPGWIPTEIYNLNMLDPRDWARYFAPEGVDAILAEHVWEHLTKADGIRAAQHCHQFLKPGGHLRVAVPDGLFPDPEYLAFVRPGGTGPSADDHKELYTYRTFQEVFERAGFRVDLLEYYDEAGRFHYQDWDPEAGKVIRSRRFYEGHQFGGIPYRSLILDAVK